MEEAIVLITPKALPKEFSDDLIKAVKKTDLKIRKDEIDYGVMAGIEWAISTLVIAYLAKPFFEAFLQEAGKDTYGVVKDEIKKFILRTKKIKTTTITSDLSPKKLSAKYDQSRSVSVKARVHSQIMVTVLFDENAADDDADAMLDGMFEMLYFLYGKANESSDTSSPGAKKNEIYLVADHINKKWEILTTQQMAERYRN